MGGQIVGTRIDDGRVAVIVVEHVRVGAGQGHRARVRRDDPLQHAHAQSTGNWISSPTMRTGTRGARQFVPGHSLRPLVTSQRQPCHGHVSAWPSRVPLLSGPPLCGQLLSSACNVPSTLASAYQRSPAWTARIFAGWHVLEACPR